MCVYAGTLDGVGWSQPLKETEGLKGLALRGGITLEANSSVQKSGWGWGGADRERFKVLRAMRKARVTLIGMGK